MLAFHGQTRSIKNNLQVHRLRGGWPITTGENPASVFEVFGVISPWRAGSERGLVIVVASPSRLLKALEARRPALDVQAGWGGPKGSHDSYKASLRRGSAYQSLPGSSEIPNASHLTPPISYFMPFDLILN